MESFFHDLVFEFLAENRFFLKNREAQIFIKLKCVIYQWIRLEKLYKLMFFFSNFVFKLLAEN